MQIYRDGKQASDCLGQGVRVETEVVRVWRQGCSWKWSIVKL